MRHYEMKKTTKMVLLFYRSFMVDNLCACAGTVMASFCSGAKI